MDTDNTAGPGEDGRVETAGPPEVDRPEHEVDYLRRTPLKRGLLRRRPKDRPYVDSGAPPLRPGDDEDHVVYVRRQRMHRPWWRRPFVVIPLILLVLLAGGATFVLTQRNVTTEVKLTDVVERFEAQQPEITKDTDAEVLDEEPSSAPVVPETEQEETAEAAPEVDVEDPYVLPAEGVYVYATTGGEKISVFGAEHKYPSRTFSTVRHVGGCRWEQRNDVIEEHVDIRRVCSKPDELFQLAQARLVTFYGQRSGDEQVCEPWASLHKLDDDKSEKATAVCHGDKGSAELTRTYLGIEPMLIEGEIEQAVRVRVEATFVGETTGGSTDDYWFSRRTGLPLRWDRTVEADSDELGPRVHYSEEASFTLVSLDPQR